MKFFLDESGDFRIPDSPDGNRVGVVAGVVVPEGKDVPFFDRFRLFLSSLPRSVFRNGETKGNLLSQDQRFAFASFIAESDGIMICPAMLDLTSLVGYSDEMKQGIVSQIEELARSARRETLRQELELLRRKISNLHPQVIARLRAWAACINRSLQDAIVLYCGPQFHTCWDTVSVEIDQVRRGADGREQQAFGFLLLSWLVAESLYRPVRTIEDVHTEDHPFVRNWCTERGVDIGKMFRGNITYSPSNASLGIQVADIAATVIRSAAAGTKNGIVTERDLSIYGLMMTKSIGREENAPGLFHSRETANPAEIMRRYAGLPTAIYRARQASPHLCATP